MKGSIFLIAILIFSSIASAYAERTASKEIDLSSIRLGTSLPLSGQAGPTGKQYLLGAETYFKKVNENGAIHGRKIEFIAMDDKYDPVISGENVHKLVNKDNVLALIGNNGSPNAIVTLPIIDREHVLLYAPYSGAQFLYKNPPDRYVINFFVSSEEQTELMIKGLLDNGIKPDEIAFFTQNDVFGDAIYKGSMKALKKFGYSNPERLPYGRYTRETLNIKGSLGTILRDARVKRLNVKVIVTAATAPANAEFAKLVYQLIPNVLIVAIPGAINNSDFDDYEGNFIFNLTIPSPFDTSLPAIKEYQEDLKRYDPKGKLDYISLYGYLTAKLFVVALQRALEANNVTREGIIDAFETFRDVDIGIGAKITLDKNKHTCLHTIFPMLIKKGKPIPFTWSELPKLYQENENKKNSGSSQF